MGSADPLLVMAPRHEPHLRTMAGRGDVGYLFVSGKLNDVATRPLVMGQLHEASALSLLQ